MRAVTTATFEQEVLQSTIPVIVDFSTDWCGPCRLLKPYLEELDKTADGRYKVVMIDAEREADLAAEYNITQVPVVLVFKQGQVVGNKFVGMASKDTPKLFAAMGIQSGN